jgi:hypothetical protein
MATTTSELAVQLHLDGRELGHIAHVAAFVAEQLAASIEAEGSPDEHCVAALGQVLRDLGVRGRTMGDRAAMLRESLEESGYPMEPDPDGVPF